MQEKYQRLVKESKGGMAAIDAVKMQNGFKGNNKLFWNCVKTVKQATSNAISVAQDKSEEILWDENKVSIVRAIKKRKFF